MAGAPDDRGECLCVWPHAMQGKVEEEGGVGGEGQGEGGGEVMPPVFRLGFGNLCSVSYSKAVLREVLGNALEGRSLSSQKSCSPCCLFSLLLETPPSVRRCHAERQEEMSSTPNTTEVPGERQTPSMHAWHGRCVADHCSPPWRGREAC